MWGIKFDGLPLPDNFTTPPETPRPPLTPLDPPWPPFDPYNPSKCWAEGPSQTPVEQLDFQGSVAT